MGKYKKPDVNIADIPEVKEGEEVRRYNEKLKRWEFYKTDRTSKDFFPPLVLVRTVKTNGSEAPPEEAPEAHETGDENGGIRWDQK